jgi:hypothetical protein
VKISRLAWTFAPLLALAAATPALSAQETPANPPATHTVKRGDTLWDLAKTYLGDAYLWPGIYRLNTDQIEDPHWIYPGEVLRLPGEAPARVIAAESVEEAPRRATARTVFTPVALTRVVRTVPVVVARPRVLLGDVLRASYLGPDNGPKGAGRIMFAADIPGIDKARSTTNFQLYDRLFMVPPAGSAALEGERFLAYNLGDAIENLGTVVIPTAIVRVVRPPRNGEAATVEVVELYGSLDAATKVIPLDTAGAGATGRPRAFDDGRVAKIRAIYRKVVLPSQDYDVMFDLSAKDGMRVGDEVELFRARERSVEGNQPAIPEIVIGTGQVVRVTPYGSTARVTSVEQPAIRVGESVRVVGRMP